MGGSSGINTYGSSKYSTSEESILVHLGVELLCYSLDYIEVGVSLNAYRDRNAFSVRTLNAYRVCVGGGYYTVV